MANPILEHALAYAANDWPVFRLSRSKVPLKGSHGHRDATTDLSVVQQWWDIPNPPNIGLACGVGRAPIALDLDGSNCLESPWGASLIRTAKANGGLPETLVQVTRRGTHLLYAPPDGVEIRTRNEPRQNKGGPGIDIKALGGYVVLSPSVSKGFRYEFHNPRPPAEMPEWLVEWCLTVGHGNHKPKNQIANQLVNARPSYLGTQQNQRDITASSKQLRQSEWNAHEEARLRAAIAAIPLNCGYDAFLRIGLALRGLDWERSDGTSVAFEIWEDWCSRSEHFNPAGLEKKWEELGRSSRGEVSLGTLFALAKEAGWHGEIESEVMPAAQNGTQTRTPDTRPQPFQNGTVGAAAVPHEGFNGFAMPVGALAGMALGGPAEAVQGLSGFGAPILAGPVFKDTTKTGKPLATAFNTRLAITALGVACTKDIFHEKCYVAGQPVDEWAGDLSDDVVLMLRQLIRDRYNFDPGVQAAHDAAVQLCLANQYDPLLDYLDSLKWDGKPRLDAWLSVYLGADDTPLNRAIGRLVLAAAVRRAYRPGSKFDQILVLEGIEGRGKSSAIEILAGGSDYYSDATILGRGDREQQEACSGVWLYEISELSGMRRTDVDHIKVFASRTVDRARPAYGRVRVDRKRRCIFIATTNEDTYLKSQTGNRRFWGVYTRHIDLAALRRDRDQLWAEAAALESQGAPLVLPEKLWDAAAAEQDRRLEVDPWQEQIRRYLDDPKQLRDDVTINEVLLENPHIQARPDAISTNVAMRVGYCMKRLHWIRYNKRIGSSFQWRYKRPS